ncbi:hypothetical protein SteCoe_10303 [Stentor coeruleus]|uniref:RING-type domain-containing protein n=1 Tax=Stentor coeruleus TaxID=5963 RepID=A0A1R2CFT7_9CILI|nr:hypothetical protein SteCoe_10303 [Stentor coeruleus]
MNYVILSVLVFLIQDILADCYKCSIFGSEFILYFIYSNKDLNAYCLPNSACSDTCQGIIVSNIETCPRSDSICLNYFHAESSGSISISKISSWNICYWFLDLRKRTKGFSIFNVETTGHVYLKINSYENDDSPRIVQQYDITRESKSEFNITGNLYEILALSMALSGNVEVKFSWNQNTSGGNDESNTIIVLSVSGAVFLIFLLCIIACLVTAIKRKRASSRVSQQIYEIVPGDCSFISHMDTNMPSKLFCSKTLIDPCVICFEKYFIIRFYFGCFVRELPCNHLFHTTCIDEWIYMKKTSSSCPLCLKPIFDFPSQLDNSLNNERSLSYIPS